MEFPTYDWNHPIFLTNKTKKTNKIKKHTDFDCKPEKLASTLKMDITKMGKLLKSEKCTIIFAS